MSARRPFSVALALAAALVAPLAVAILPPTAASAAVGTAAQLASATNDTPPLPANSESDQAVVSADGRFVVFRSRSSNLSPLVPVGGNQIYIRDVASNTTTLVSSNGSAAANRSGAQSPSVSADGSYVAYVSAASNVTTDTNGQGQVLVWSRQSGETIVASRANGLAGALSNPGVTDVRLSADGRVVAFMTEASLTGQDTRGQLQLYRRDLVTGQTSMVSEDTTTSPRRGSPIPLDRNFSISGDGSKIAFSTSAQLTKTTTGGFAQAYVRDSGTGTTEVISLDSLGMPGDGASTEVSLSLDGLRLAYRSESSRITRPEDPKAPGAGYVRDLASRTTSLVSADHRGRATSIGTIAISGDGVSVVFTTYIAGFLSPSENETGQLQVYVHDIETGATSRRTNAVSGTEPGNRHSINPSISGDGSIVAFQSLATNLVEQPVPAGTPEIYVVNRPAPSVERIGGADRFVVSASVSASFVPADGPRQQTVFVASGEVFPDALAAAAAAGAIGAPVLLVGKDSVPEATKAELLRIHPAEIVIVGGIAAISTAVESTLRPFAKVTTTRLAGADRFVGAVKISQTYFKPGTPVVYLASGENFPDALGGAAAAGRQQGPVLLVRKDTLPTEVKAELTRLTPGKIVVLGGRNAVSDGVLGDAGAFGNTTRLGGADRFEVSAALSKAVFPTGIQTVYVASGETFPDALSGGPAAIAAGGPVLLVGKTTIDPTVRTELVRLNPNKIVVLGGVNAISDTVFTELKAYLK